MSASEMLKRADDVLAGPKYYADRDALRQDFYFRHVNQMTAEGLHSKADIAAELAHRDQIIRDLAAALRASNQVPDGWVMVPREATREMCHAAATDDYMVGGQTEWDGIDHEQCADIYRKMISAAPAPHVAAGGEDKVDKLFASAAVPDDSPMFARRAAQSILQLIEAHQPINTRTLPTRKYLAWLCNLLERYAAPAAPVQDGGEKVSCRDCCGYGVDGEPDGMGGHIGGATCSTCEGSGLVPKPDEVEVLRFDFGDQDYIVENNAEGWASFYECFAPGGSGDIEEVTVSVEMMARSKLAALPEWGN